MKVSIWKNSLTDPYGFDSFTTAQFIYVYRDINGFSFGRAEARKERLFSNLTFRRGRYSNACGAKIYASDKALKNRSLEYRSFDEMSYII